VLGAAELDNCGWLASSFYIIIPMLRRRSSTPRALLVGKMMVFDLIWIMTSAGRFGRRDGLDLHLQACIQLNTL